MKTVCVYHSIDLDGWMSAAIVKYWWSKGKELTSLEDTIDFIGYNYGQPIPDLSEYDEVIMCDISFPKDIMIELLNKFDNKLIWIDHHYGAFRDIIGIENITTDGKDISTAFNGLRDTKFAACELTWKYFFPNKPMPEIVRLLGRYDCFGHKGTDEEQKVLEFQYGARQCISNYEEVYDWLKKSLFYNSIDAPAMTFEEMPEQIILNKGKSIYQYLCTEAKQIYKNGFQINLLEPHPDAPRGFVFTGEFMRAFICFNKERFNPINFGIDYHKEEYDGAACFYFDGEQFNFSLYNDNGEVDCSVIAKTFGGGGHKGAAGFRCDLETFNKIVNGNS